MDARPTKLRILDAAENMVRRRGFNGFSYADVADAIGIKKASLHHHFPAKMDLGLALVERYYSSVLNNLEEIDRSSDGTLAKLNQYSQMYVESFQENQMCLCGMLAAEHEAISQEMQSAIEVFFDKQEAWLQEVLTVGRQSGELTFSGPASQHARIIITTFQGALLIAKSLNSPERITTASHLIETYRRKT